MALGFGHQFWLNFYHFYTIIFYFYGPWVWAILCWAICGPKKNSIRAKLVDILRDKIERYKNSLLRTNEKNTFIYAYITTANCLIMQKFKIVSNDAKTCIQIIKTFLLKKLLLFYIYLYA